MGSEEVIKAENYHYVLLVILVALVLLTGCVPGYIAWRRGHPNAKAINLCGWIGLIVWPCWIVAIIWAYTGPDRPAPPKPGSAAPVHGPSAPEEIKSRPEPVYRPATQPRILEEDVPRALSRREREKIRKGFLSVHRYSKPPSMSKRKTRKG